MNDNVDLVIKSGKIPSIRVTAGQNLIDGIITEIQGNTLYLRNENRCNWVRNFGNNYVVEITCDSLDHIIARGSGNLTCDDTLRSSEFTFDSWNAGGSIRFLVNCPVIRINNAVGRADIHMAGITHSVLFYLNDVATLEASSLHSDLVYLNNKSTGDMSVRVKDELYATINYTGNVYYYGSPYKTELIRNGTGKFIHAGN